MELKSDTEHPFFRFGIDERYEDLLRGGRTVVTESPELTFIWRKCGTNPDFRKTYSIGDRWFSSHPKWTVGAVVGHIYKLIDEYIEFHSEKSDCFIDRSICGFSYDPEKEEIHIEDQS
jgi:hypothetical protein